MHSIALGAVQVKPIWISCLLVALLLVALIVRYRRRALLYVLEQKRRQERLEAHRFLQEVALLCARMVSLLRMPLLRHGSVGCVPDAIGASIEEGNGNGPRTI